MTTTFQLDTADRLIPLAQYMRERADKGETFRVVQRWSHSYAKKTRACGT